MCGLNRVEKAIWAEISETNQEKRLIKKKSCLSQLKRPFLKRPFF